MDSKMIARVGAVAFVAIALTMTALQMRDAPNPREDVFEVPLDESETDPVRQALIDCARRAHGLRMILSACALGPKTGDAF